MKSTVVDEAGNVRCPNCNATSFVEKRTGKAKWLAVPTIGIAVLAMPKRLKCSGCGTNLKRGDGKSGPTATDRMAEANAQHKAAVADAKLGAVGDPLPPGIHPKSMRARQIYKAREKAAQTDN